MYFPLVDHLIQELNDRLLSQENHFLGQYLVPANDGVQDELYETKKTDILETRPIYLFQCNFSFNSLHFTFTNHFPSQLTTDCSFFNSFE